VNYAQNTYAQKLRYMHSFQLRVAIPIGLRQAESGDAGTESEPRAAGNGRVSVKSNLCPPTCFRTAHAGTMPTLQTSGRAKCQGN